MLELMSSIDQDELHNPHALPIFSLDEIHKTFTLIALETAELFYR